MLSENKTPNIGLNQWQGNENVKRQDFVEDNLKIDEAINSLQEVINSNDNQIGILTSDIEDLQTEVTSHKADIEPHGKYANTNDMVYTNGKLTSVDEKISNVLRKRTTLTYTGDDLTNVNIKAYATNGTTIVSEYNDVLTYTSGNLTGVQRTVIL